MNTRAEADMISGIIDFRREEYDPKEVNRKKRKKKKIFMQKQKKDSVMRMEHQCSARQQFRRKTTPSR